MKKPIEAGSGPPSYPDWYLEAIRGAEGLIERGEYEAAMRVKFQAGLALLSLLNANLKDSRGNPIVGENESTQYNNYTPGVK